jgi:hypothetical protein
MKKIRSKKSRDTVPLKDDYPKPCSISPKRGTVLFVIYTHNNEIFSVAICDVIIRSNHAVDYTTNTYCIHDTQRCTKFTCSEHGQCVLATCHRTCVKTPCAGIFKQPKGARNRVGKGLSYWQRLYIK